MKDDFDMQMKGPATTGSLLGRYCPQKPRRLLLKTFNKSNSEAVLLFSKDNNGDNQLTKSSMKELAVNEPLANGNDTGLKLKLFSKTDKRDEPIKGRGLSSPLKDLGSKVANDNFDSLPKFDKNNSRVTSIANIPFTNAEILASFQSQQKMDFAPLSPFRDYQTHHSLLKLKQKNREGEIKEASSSTTNVKQFTSYLSFPSVNSGSQLHSKFLKDSTSTFSSLFTPDQTQEASLKSKKQPLRFLKSKEELSPDYLATKRKIQIILKRKTDDKCN